MAASPIYPRTLAIGLMLSPPGLADPGAEVAAAGYARQVVQFSLSNEHPGALANPAIAQYPRAASRWGSVGWLTAWTLDGEYAGYGPLTTPTTIAAGDVARFAIGALLLTDRNAPSLYGAGLYGAGLYSAGVRTPPRPYSRGSYGSGPYSRNAHTLAMLGTLSAPFVPEQPCCPDAASWTPAEPCGAGVWSPVDPCPAAAAHWTLEALP